MLRTLRVWSSTISFTEMFVGLAELDEDTAQVIVALEQEIMRNFSVWDEEDSYICDWFIFLRHFSAVSFLLYFQLWDFSSLVALYRNAEKYYGKKRKESFDCELWPCFENTVDKNLCYDRIAMSQSCQSNSGDHIADTWFLPLLLHTLHWSLCKRCFSGVAA